MIRKTSELKKCINMANVWFVVIALLYAIPLLGDERPNPPLDHFFGSQWGLLNRGTGIDIDAVEAWKITTGDPGIIVAVIDSGADLDHPDLLEKITVSRNFVDDQPAEDINGHGSAVAGTAAAATNNGDNGNEGIAGVCWDCSLMILRAGDDTDSDGVSEYSSLAVANAVSFAVAHNASVINLSFSGPRFDLVQNAAIQSAIEMGVTVVAAMGNHGSDTTHYPAAYQGVIAVGATEPDDEVWSSSALGSHLSIVAPGVLLPALDHQGGYGATQTRGTSFAAPYVSGVAGLLKSLDSELKPQAIKNILERSAEPYAKTSNFPSPQLPIHYYLGTGRLNALNALSAVHFNDLEYDFEKDVGEWHLPYVMYSFQENIIKGLSTVPPTFGPTEPVTRAQAAKMAYLAAGRQTSFPEEQCEGEQIFLDVPLSSWFCSYAADSFGAGYLLPKDSCADSEGTVTCESSTGLCFCPDMTMTRGEVAELIFAAFTDFDFRLDDGACDAQSPGFPDVEPNATYCKPVLWLSNSVLELSEQFQLLRRFPNDIPSDPLISGYPDRTFRPDRPVNRAEMAKFVSSTRLFCIDGPEIADCESQKSLHPPTSKSGLGRVSLGTFYEQEIAIGNNSPEPVRVSGGDNQIVSEPFSFMDLDTHDTDGDELFYFWNATGGSWTTTDPVNFSEVAWHPPEVPEDTTFRISVLRGDRRGKVGRGTFYFTVPATGSGSNSPGSGSIASPSGTQTGNVTVQATVNDSDGLESVYVTFSDGQPLMLCGVGTSACSGSSGTYTIPDVNPASYGASPGQVTIRLFVEDAEGNVDEVGQRIFTYDPQGQGDTFTLTVRKQGDGDGTVSGSGINCGPGCSSQSLPIPEGASVTLNASEEAGSTFLGFAGDICYGAGTCELTMYRDIEVRISFGLPDQLAVLFSTPGPGDTDVSPSDQVRIHFNREVGLGSSYSDITFSEANGPAITFDAVIRDAGSTANRVLSLIPEESLERNVDYQITVPAGAVEDDLGEQLAIPYQLSFSVAEQDAPQMYLDAYPRRVMEGGRTRLDIWFDQPAAADRVITITSTPDGLLDHTPSLTLSAGTLSAVTWVDTDQDSSIDHSSALIQISAPGFGQRSIPIQILNDTNIIGTDVRWQAVSFSGDDNGNGVIEAGESVDMRLDVVNWGDSPVQNLELHLEILNTLGIDVLRGDSCYIGRVEPGDNAHCFKEIRTDADLPTGSYRLQISASTLSSPQEFLETERIPVVNTELPDYTIQLGPTSNNELPPGHLVDVSLSIANASNGFSVHMVPYEIVLEVDGTERLLYKGVSNARGGDNPTQSISLNIVIPTTPGTHYLRARVNPTGPEQLPEADYTNNSSVDRVLRTKGANQEPVLQEISATLFVKVGEEIQLTAVASDADDDPITYSLGPGAPAGMSIGSSSGVLTWTPQCGQEGSVAVEIIATDDESASDSEVVTFNVGLSADLRAQLGAASAVAIPGTEVDWTLTISNLGPSCTTAADVAVLLPADLVDGTWSCAAAAGAACTSSGNGSIVDSVDLPVGGTATYTLSARIADSAQGVVVATGTVTATGATVDPVSGNNSGSDSISLTGLDFGDAPNSTLGGQWLFPTQLSEDGARHGVDPTLFLGTAIDADLDGRPTLSADGDDLASADDDDGVVFSGELVPCGSSSVEVTASAAGLLDAWIDFDTNGTWDVPAEQIFTSEAVGAGTNILSFSVPCTTTPSALAFARFRLSRAGGLSPGGLALDGEVEDYGAITAQVFRTLITTRDGVGSGIVIASPNGIQCGDDCQESYPVGSVIVLSAPPDYGSTFLGWSGGGCSGTGTCVLTMDQDHTVNATFGLDSFPLTISLAGGGTGSVVSSPPGIDCGNTCSQPFTFGSMVTLTATPDANSVFSGWSGGGCSGTGPCSVLIDQAVSVTATFELPRTLTVFQEGEGAGTITSSPAGVTCGAVCSAEFPDSTEVTLTASAQSGSVFSGWSGGGCSGSGTCTLTMDRDISVTATFDLHTGSPSDLSILEPSGGDDQADRTFTITWDDGDPTGEAWISLYYDPDAAGVDGTLIASRIAASSTTNQHIWRTRFVPDGSYYVYAVLTQSGNPPVVAYSSNTVQIGHQVPLTVCSNGCDYPTLQEAIEAAGFGDRISVAAGTYSEIGQIVIDKDLTIQGAGLGQTIFRPAADTGSSGDSRGWWLVTPGVLFDLGDVTLDGSGFKVYQGIRHRGEGLVQRVALENLQFNPSGPEYAGSGVVAFGSGPVDVFSSTFQDIGRTGILYFGTGVSGSIASGNTYVGKGLGHWLDYGIEVGNGASVDILGNTFSNNRSLEAVEADSAGVLITTYFGSGTQALVAGNTFLGSDYGLAVGFGASDTSMVLAHRNYFAGNSRGVYSSGPVVDARHSFWGDSTGPSHTSHPAGRGDSVSDPVDFIPYLSAWTEDLVIQSYSPVDLIVEFNGLVTTKAVQGIPGSSYAEADFNGDGEINDRVTITNAPVGHYEVTVEADETAVEGDTYSLTVEHGAQYLEVISDAPVLEAMDFEVMKDEEEQVQMAVDSSMLAHGGFEEGSGSTTSFGGVDATLEGGVDWGAGQSGSGLNFDGSGYVSIPDPGASPFDLTEALTIALWLRPEALDGSQVLVSKDPAFELELGKVGDSVYNLRLENVVAGHGQTQLRPEVWQHLAVTWDGAVVRYFYNGVLDGEAAFEGVLATNDTTLGIGARIDTSQNGGPAFFFRGLMDDVQLYDRALTPSEIAVLMGMTHNDSTPPHRSQLEPGQPLPLGTTSAEAHLATDEDATCRYASESGRPFEEMTPFGTTGARAHTHTVTGLADHQIYRFFVRCADVLGNTNAEEAVIAFGVADDVDILQGLTAYWAFDEEDGCVVYDLAGTYDGLLMPQCPVGSPQRVAGIRGSALSFEGGDQEVLVSDVGPLATSSQLTISAWIQHDTVFDFRAILDQRDSPADGYDLYLSPQSRLFMRFNSITHESHAVVADGTWHHVAAIYDGTEVRLYVDGILDSRSAAASSTLNTTSPLHLGRHFTNSSNGLTGVLDEVLIHSRALSDIEVLQVYLETR